MQKQRRVFIKNMAKASVALAVVPSFLQSCGGGKKTTTNNLPVVNNAASWAQAPLPYLYNALEPFIDAATMELHYSKHAAAYAKNMNDAAVSEAVDMNKMHIESICADIAKYSSKMRNNAGGHYNHELFWKMMAAPIKDNKPTGKLMIALEEGFGSFESFKTQFTDAGKNRFGSGWAWLVMDANKKLVITSTPNQDNPLMPVSDVKGKPLLCLDVWEHAYYLKYQNKRADYIANWWFVVNWNFVAERFATG
jgi:superoxide dismutase, Fe-Mn family